MGRHGTMGCEKFREGLELVASLDDKEPNLQETITHIKECAKCADAFATVRKLDKVMREKMDEVEVPPFFASRIRSNLRETSSGSKANRWQWAYLAGAFLFAASLLFYNQVKIISRLESLVVTTPSGTVAPAVTPVSHVADEVEILPSHSMLLDIISAHALKRHRSILASKFVVFENNMVNSSFRERFTFPVKLPKFSDKLKLVGGSKCHSCNYEMGYLLYREGRNSVSLCIFPAKDFGLSNWSGKARTFQKDGYNLAVWKKAETVYALVFEIPMSDVKKIVWDLQ